MNKSMFTLPALICEALDAIKKQTRIEILDVPLTAWISRMISAVTIKASMRTSEHMTSWTMGPRMRFNNLCFNFLLTRRKKEALVRLVQTQVGFVYVG